MKAITTGALPSRVQPCGNDDTPKVTGSGAKGGRPTWARPLKSKNDPECKKSKTAANNSKHETLIVGVEASSCAEERRGNDALNCTISNAERLRSRRAQPCGAGDVSDCKKFRTDRDASSLARPNMRSDGLDQIVLLGGSKGPGALQSGASNAMPGQVNPLRSNSGSNCKEFNTNTNKSSLTMPTTNDEDASRAHARKTSRLLG